jgi:putative lipoprotein
MRCRSALLAGPAALALAACQPFGADSETVTGTLTLRDGIALPPEAVAVVSVVDISPTDARDALLGRTEIIGPSGPPIPFAVRYQPAAVDPERQYGVRAQIMVNQELWFASDHAYPVLTHGAPDRVEVLLDLPAPPPVD